MRTSVVVCLALGCVLGSEMLPLRANIDDAALGDRVPRLIQQLGDDSFVAREAASKELEAIGDAALEALRKAASAAKDPEIRQRAAGVIQAIAESATRKELEKLQGTWSLVSYETDGKQIKGEDKTHLFIFKGEQWSTHVGGQIAQAGTVARVEKQEKFNAIDLVITEGSSIGVTALSIYAIDGDSLKYLNFGGPRPTEFATKPGDGYHFLTFRRTKR